MAVMWTVAELELENVRYNVGGSFGGLDSDDYLKLNPNAKIPTINDNGRILWESNAIVRYLSSEYGRGTLYPEDRYPAALSDQWMDWVKTSFYPVFHTVFFGLIRTPPESRNQRAIDHAIPAVGEILRIVERHLKQRKFMGGDTLTMGDIPLGSCMYRYFNLDIARPALPNLEAWYQRLCEREPYRKNVMIPFGNSVEEWHLLEREGLDREECASS